jgi:hypothetical protein
MKFIDYKSGLKYTNMCKPKKDRILVVCEKMICTAGNRLSETDFNGPDTITENVLYTSPSSNVAVQSYNYQYLPNGKKKPDPTILEKRALVINRMVHSKWFNRYIPIENSYYSNRYSSRDKRKICGPFGEISHKEFKIFVRKDLISDGQLKIFKYSDRCGFRSNGQSIGFFYGKSIPSIKKFENTLSLSSLNNADNAKSDQFSIVNIIGYEDMMNQEFGDFYRNNDTVFISLAFFDSTTSKDCIVDYINYNFKGIITDDNLATILLSL